jgi:AmmeMemoRadiSam system protein A
MVVQVYEFSPEEQHLLLDIARTAVTAVANHRLRPHPDLDNLPPRFREPRACFVTLTIEHDLRGCTGTIVARVPLAEEVSYSAAHTANNDPRFAPVTAEEVPLIRIEISVLTEPTLLHVDSPDQLLRLLRPGIDGVVLNHGDRRSTYLPQVWEKLPDPSAFLASLCRKMGMPRDAWRSRAMQVATYQVVSFEEP